jgi:F-type H+-transporting ATPase subunit a
MVEGAMGEKNARRFFPLVGTLWIFILFGNLIGLVPGFVSPNDTLKTNVALAGIVFFATHICGIKENGIGYLKHFLGPMMVIAPLMLVIELVNIPAIRYRCA